MPKKPKKAAKKIKQDVEVVDTGRNVKLIVNGHVKRTFRNMEDYKKSL